MNTGTEIGSKIKEMCKEKDGSVRAMEQALGFANGYVRGLIVRNTMPSAARLRKIADYFGVTPDFLLGNDTPKSDLPASGGVLIPVLGRVAAGIPISAVENVIGQEEISQQTAARGEYFALKIKGDSMSPYIMDGDIVVVRQQDTAENDEIVIALVNGNDGCCKRYKKGKSSVTLISLNPAYEPMVFTQDEVDEIPVRIIGKVVEIRREVL